MADNENKDESSTGYKASRLDTMQQVYPYTKMNFLVTLDGQATSGKSMAAFTEVSGINASVDVIEFRQGNSGSMAKAKIPGLVKYSNVTFRFGYTVGTDIIDWMQACMDPVGRKSMIRHDVYVEIINPQRKTINATVTTHGTSDGQVYIMKNAFVASYKGADLDAKTSDVAIESIEIAFEEMTFPDNTESTDMADMVDSSAKKSDEGSAS